MSESGFNRSIMKCKFSVIFDGKIHIESFNRSIMKCKWIGGDDEIEFIDEF